jgi:arabinose-5-phosphate isomerase
MEHGLLLGIVTDGDVRRAFERVDSFDTLTASDVMTPEPLTISPDVSLFDADQVMREAKITALVVVDSLKKVLGVIQIHD